MDGNTGRHARSASFSYPAENENTASVNNEPMSQTSRRRRMDRYAAVQPTERQTQPPAENLTNRQTAPAAGYIAPTTGSSYRQPANPQRVIRNDPETSGQRPVRTDPRSYPERSAVTGQMPPYNGSQNGYTMPQTPYNGQRQVRMASNGRPISEWQKNVPNPPMMIRRDLTEDGEDPLIASTRSPEVYNRTGKFWDEGEQTASGSPVNPGMYTERNTAWNARANGEIFPDVPPDAEEPGTGKKQRTKPLATVGIFIAGLFVIWLLLRFTLFRVGMITVTGTENYTDEYVIRLSGVHIGDNMMTLNEEQIGTGIANDVHLKLDYLEKKVPGEIVIAVKERQPAAYLNYCGITYVTDKSGMVLDENEDPEYHPEELIEVKGMKIRTSFTTGQNLPLVTEEQGEVFKSLFLEIRVIGCNNLIREIDLSKPDEVYLLTSDDISVAMGNNINFHAKLRSMMVVREEIISRGYTGGTIDVTDPEHPIYVPPVL